MSVVKWLSQALRWLLTITPLTSITTLTPNSDTSDIN